MDQKNIYKAVNLSDPRQDVHRERKHDPNLHRYRIAEKLLPTNSYGLSVLELGGGIGKFSRLMLARRIRVTFVDLNEHNIQKARALDLEAYRIDLNSGLSEFPNKKFHGVVMLEVIEHIVAAEFLLEEVSRVLKSDGFLILSIPNFAFFKNRLRILLGNLSHDEGYHYRFFTKKVLRERLSNAGFILEKEVHTMPAFGYNFIFNRIFGYPRRHIQVPPALASLFAQTLIVKASKL